MTDEGMQRNRDSSFSFHPKSRDYPAWIRTRTKRTKISCATVTLPGSGVPSKGDTHARAQSQSRESKWGVTVRGTHAFPEARLGSNRDGSTSYAAYPRRFAY